MNVSRIMAGFSLASISAASQGDTRQSGTPRDGAVSRRQIAEVLVHALTAEQALRKTFELVAEAGRAPADFDAQFAPLASDRDSALDGVRDADNMPLSGEPARVLADLEAERRRAGAQQQEKEKL